MADPIPNRSMYANERIPAHVPVVQTPSGDFVPQQGTSSGAPTTSPGNLTPKGYQQITDLASAASLTVPTGATVALIQAETQSIRWRDDGTSPTTTVGMVLAAGESVFYTGNLATFKAIEVTASAKLNVSYYG